MHLEIKDLKESNEFLNIVFDNINAAIFIVDGTFEIRSLNSACARILGREVSQIEGQKCGNGLGCVYELNGKKGCGNNAECGSCILRKDILQTFTESVPRSDEILEREFKIGHELKNKIFKYSTRYITYLGEKMVIVIMEDITNEEHRKRKLQEQYNKIKEMNNLFKDELHIAAKVQQSILPEDDTSIENGKVFVKYLPYNSVSGDYYDIVKTGDGKYIIFLIDITGHGVPAALYTTLTKAMLFHILKESSTASEIMTLLNREISSIVIEGYYFPAVLLMVDSKKGELKYVSASGPKPVIISDGNLREFEGKGPMLGIDEDYIYEEKRINVKSGDRIYIYTDGIMAVRDNNGEIVNIREEKIEEYFSEGSKEEIKKSINHMLEKIAKIGRYEDDITIMGIEF